MMSITHSESIGSAFNFMVSHCLGESANATNINSKGSSGQMVEKLLGLSGSSSKAPDVQLKNGDEIEIKSCTVIPKTVGTQLTHTFKEAQKISQASAEDILSTPFHASFVARKLKRIFLAVITRQSNSQSLISGILDINIPRVSPLLWSEIEQDYYRLQALIAVEGWGSLSSSGKDLKYGRHLCLKTSGTKGNKTGRSFYLRSKSLALVCSESVLNKSFSPGFILA